MAKLTNSPGAPLTLDLERRKSFMLKVTVIDNEENPVDLTGSTMRFVMKEGEYDNDSFDLTNLVRFSENANISNPTAGYGMFTFQAAELDGDPGQYFGTVVLMTPAGYSVNLLNVQINLQPNTESLSMHTTYLEVQPPTAVEVMLRGGQSVTVRTQNQIAGLVNRGPCVRTTTAALLTSIGAATEIAYAELRPVNYPSGGAVEVIPGDVVLKEGAGLLGGTVSIVVNDRITVITRFAG